MKSTKSISSQTDIQWQWIMLEDMQPDRLYDLLALRESIFVVEQKCIYQELDGIDKRALHFVATCGHQSVACLRLIPPYAENKWVRIGRVAVSKPLRKQGIARYMMQKAMQKAAEEFPGVGLYVHAQSYLEEFYQSLDFHLSGPEFIEDGIPHIPMNYRSEQ